MTLLELILVMVIIAIIAGLLSNIINYEIDTYNLVTRHHEALQNFRRALQMMSRDIRQIMAPNSIFQASEDSLRFDDVNDFMISYNFLNNLIQRNGDALIDSVNIFQFSYFDDTGNPLSVPVTDPSNIRSIALSLTTRIDGAALTFQTKITPRNY